jgi:YfiH family protein
VTNTVRLVYPSIFTAFHNVRCAVSTRQGGVSADPYGMNLSFSVGDRKEEVEENRRRFFAALRIPSDRLAFARQHHSANVAVAEEPGTFETTDALVTNRSNLWLVVTVADCIPLFLLDPGRNVAAVVHAGWKGSVSKITGKTVAVMRDEFGSVPKDLFAYIGPSAGACCYEVGKEVAEQFEGRFVTSRGTRLYLDLKRENLNQLTSAGLTASNVEISPECTICGSDLFHSYRRDKERSGRMMGVIGIKPVME